MFQILPSVSGHLLLSTLMRKAAEQSVSEFIVGAKGEESLVMFPFQSHLRDSGTHSPKHAGHCLWTGFCQTLP